MILTIVLNDKFHNTAVTISLIHIWRDRKIPWLYVELPNSLTLCLRLQVIRNFFFTIVDTLLRRNKQTALPTYDSPLTMASVMKKKSLIKLQYSSWVSLIRSEFTILLISFNGLYYDNVPLLVYIILTLLLTLNF